MRTAVGRERGLKATTFFAVTLVPTFAAAQEAPPPPAWTSNGQLGLESRVFRDDGDRRTRDQAVGMLGRLEVRHDHGAFAEKVRGFGRLDALDRERDTLIAEEAWAQVQGSRVRLRLGVDIVDWSVLEAFHPADVVNARNLDSDIESFEKIGEPMAALQVRAAEATTVTCLFMPAYMQTRLPSPRSRLSFAPPGVDLRGQRKLLDRDGALVVDRDFGPQAALQIRQVIGPADVAVHALEHMDRMQPVVLVDPATGAPSLLFQTVRQAGASYTQVAGAFIVKLEGSYRWFVPPGPAAAAVLGPLPSRNHGTVAAGLEYGLTHRNGSQSTLFLEGQTVLGPSADARRALTPFQRDVFLGLRLARNDEASQELHLGVVADIERLGEYLVSASYQQRLGDNWTVNLGLRVFDARAVPPLDARGLEPLRNGDHLRITLLRHF